MLLKKNAQSIALRLMFSAIVLAGASGSVWAGPGAPLKRDSVLSIPLSTAGQAELPQVRARAWAALDEKGRLVGGHEVDTPMPIASITKLMMAMAYLDAKPDLSKIETIEAVDVDTLKNSRSRLKVGSRMPRADLLRLALVSSENRAASALARSYPGGTDALVMAMNAKARALGLSSARFVEPTGLSPQNVASARDVAALALAARGYPEAVEAARMGGFRQEFVRPDGTLDALGYKNTNKALREGRMEAVVSKTGYINEAGKCLAWALSGAQRAAGFAMLGAPSFVVRDNDGLRLSAWAQGKPPPVAQEESELRPKGKLKGRTRAVFAGAKAKIKLKERVKDQAKTAKTTKRSNRST